MAGTIIADYIRSDASKLSINVGDTTVATINSSGILSNTGSTIIAANGQIGLSALPSITSDKIASVSNTAITTGLGYTPPNPNVKADLRFSSTNSRTHQGLMFYITGGTITANQIPFFASTKAQAEALAPYVVISFINYIKNLENDYVFDQLYNQTLVNSSIFSYFPASLTTTGIDVDETSGVLATAYNTTDYFRVIVASNGVDKVWTTGLVKATSEVTGGTAPGPGTNLFHYQTVDGESTCPSTATTLGQATPAGAMKVTEASSITGSSGSVGIVLPIPLSVALNF